MRGITGLTKHKTRGNKMYVFLDYLKIAAIATVGALFTWGFIIFMAVL